MTDYQSLDEIGKTTTLRNQLQSCKSLIFLLILFIIIRSDLFAKYCLSRIPATMLPDGSTTLRGVLIQGVLLVLLFVLVDLLVKYGLI